ncbi:anhydro-N-acetylmuramic acid kinase [Pleomorphovibrio marinus]|uniref:anhydro-N-acetylmuramic acid kinase n=1 Tax=Pleomorphovibrio marinus TaxID=2164132 RepID=UPI000E0C9FC4|nr:anhydro-N-acetylmuramic acid kinase [Pleomorphovibrio marinus]
MDASSVYPMIGLMSGTSGDGLDLVFTTFRKTEKWDFTLHFGDTIPFPATLQKQLKEAHFLNANDLALLDIKFGRWMGEMVKKTCQNKKIAPLAIASHGHTVFHQPDKSLTLQIGNGWALHAASGLPVINDFRSLDVQLGGQGAPLVPIGDLHLFPEAEFCLNLGGIANISIKEENEILAFDICPFNLLFNHFAQKLGKDFDENGALAKTGNENQRLFNQLESLSYYQRSGAKSLGREDIEQHYFPILEGVGLKPEDILATLTTHYVTRIVACLEGKRGTLMPTGGGAFNRYFISQLERRLPETIRISLPDKSIISLKEALIFAFLGALRLNGENNCLASVTGACKDSCGGLIYGF